MHSIEHTGEKKKKTSQKTHTVSGMSVKTVWIVLSKNMPTLYTQILLDNIMCFNEMQEFREKEKVCVTEMWKEEKVWNEAGSSQCYNMTF